MATLTMARLQRQILDDKNPPRIGPTKIDEADMIRRVGSGDRQGLCLGDEAEGLRRSRRREAEREDRGESGPSCKAELEAFSVPVDVMVQALKDSGGPTTAKELGIDVDFYREAVIHARRFGSAIRPSISRPMQGYLRDFAQNEG